MDILRIIEGYNVRLCSYPKKECECGCHSTRTYHGELCCLTTNNENVIKFLIKNKFDTYTLIAHCYFDIIVKDMIEEKTFNLKYEIYPKCIDELDLLLFEFQYDEENHKVTLEMYYNREWDSNEINFSFHWKNNYLFIQKLIN